MTSIYKAKLGFKIQLIKVKAQKIDEFSLAIDKIVIAKFQISDKLDKSFFF